MPPEEESFSNVLGGFSNAFPTNVRATSENKEWPPRVDLHFQRSESGQPSGQLNDNVSIYTYKL